MQRAVQKGRRFVSERGVERNENTSISSGVTDTNAISPRCNQGTFDGGATYQSRPPDTQQRRLRQRHMRRAGTARDSTNQSSPPGMQRAVQKGRRFVSECSVELSKNASASSGDTDTSDNFRKLQPRGIQQWRHLPT